MKGSDLITYEQLMEFEDRLLNKIKVLLIDSISNKRFIRTKELKKRLGGVSDASIQALRIQGLLPYTKFGGIYLYDWDAVENYIISNQENKNNSRP